jgi:hypothetical protein
MGLFPATVYFILLSAALTSAALLVFHTLWDAELLSSRLLDSPDALLACHTAHVRVLEALRRVTGRFSPEFTSASLACLVSFRKGLDATSSESIRAALPKIGPNLDNSYDYTLWDSLVERLIVHDDVASH